MKLPVKLRKSSLLTKILILLILVGTTATLVSQRARVRANEAAYQALSEEAARQYQENQALQKDIDALGTDDSVRKIARDELGLVENGEIIFYDAGD